MVVVMLIPFSLLAQEQVERKPEPKATRVVVPAKPHPAEITKLIAELEKRTRLALAFREVPVGNIVKAISKLSGIKISASRKAGRTSTTLLVRGEVSLIEVLDDLCRMGDLHTVVEPSGIVRVLAKEEYRLMIVASGASVGKPVPVPAYYPQLEFRVLAYAEKSGLDVDLVAEKKRLLAWLDKNKGENRRHVLANPIRIASYHGLDPDRGGRLSKDILWFPHRVTPSDRGGFEYSHSRGSHADATLALFSDERLAAGPRKKDEFLVEFLAVNMKERGFTTMDLNRKGLLKSKGLRGQALLFYELKEEPARAYLKLTGRYIRRGMAVILDGYLISAPILMSRIPGRGQILGLPEARIDQILKALGR